MSNTKISIESQVPVKADRIWEYWTNPEHITQWNFASEDWCCPSATNDLRVGGSFTSRMEAKDGSFGFDFSGIYDEIEPLKTISYTLEDGRKVVTRFEPVENGTKIKTEFDAESQNPVEMQRNGWQAILDNFARYALSK